MIGETITIYGSRPVTDRLGNTKREWYKAQTVDNCLVSTGRDAQTQTVTDAKRPDIREADYTVALPKTYSGPSLAGCRVVLSGRGDVWPDDALDVRGTPDVQAMSPVPWNMLVRLVRLDG